MNRSQRQIILKMSLIWWWKCQSANDKNATPLTGGEKQKKLQFISNYNSSIFLLKGQNCGWPWNNGVQYKKFYADKLASHGLTIQDYFFWDLIFSFISEDFNQNRFGIPNYRFRWLILVFTGSAYPPLQLLFSFIFLWCSAHDW